MDTAQCLRERKYLIVLDLAELVGVNLSFCKDLLPYVFISRKVVTLHRKSHRISDF